MLPFTTVEDMYKNTQFRLAMIPATSYEDNFKYSPDPMWQKIYAERIQPHLQEYADYQEQMVHFIEDDFTTALWDSYIPIA